jgi:hypothetical protein
MSFNLKNIGLIYFVIITLLLVGLIPLLLTGWFLSGQSGDELRAVEGRYQTQLVQDKARQIEMFVQRYGDLVRNFAGALEMSESLTILSSRRTEEQLGAALKENPNLLALYVKPADGESLSVFRAEKITREEIEKAAANASANLGEKKINFGAAHKISASGEVILPIVTPVVIDEKTSAVVTAIVSLREFSRIMAESKQMSEDEMWQAGLPILFVVDSQGNAIFHPDVENVNRQTNLSNLKIVQEWKESRRSIKRMNIK